MMFIIIFFDDRGLRTKAVVFAQRVIQNTKIVRAIMDA